MAVSDNVYIHPIHVSMAYMTEILRNGSWESDVLCWQWPVGVYQQYPAIYHGRQSVPHFSDNVRNVHVCIQDLDYNWAKGPTYTEIIGKRALSLLPVHPGQAFAESGEFGEDPRAQVQPGISDPGQVRRLGVILR